MKRGASGTVHQLSKACQEVRVTGAASSNAVTPKPALHCGAARRLSGRWARQELGGQLLSRGSCMNGTRDPTLAGQRAGGGGERGSIVSLTVRTGAHERVLVLGAVRGGGQRVLSKGGHHRATPIREGG